jgi:MarR family transcriptional regulator for hemolysin
MALNRLTSAGYMTNLAGRLLVRALERRLAPIGLAPAHMPVLLALEAGPLPQKALAARANVEQPTMTATLNRMERDGLIERLPNPEDGRSSLVALTPLARAKQPDVEAVVEEINDMALGGLTAEERAQYFALLGRVIAALEADGQPD